MNKHIEKAQKLTAMMAEQSALAKKLERSLAIQELIPNVFDSGSIKSAWIKPSGVDRINTATRYKLIFRVTKGDGEVFEFPLGDVPEILHPNWNQNGGL